MATIELYKDKINSMSNYIEQAKSAVSDFCVDLSALKTKILGINSSVCDGIISKISTSSQTQEQQIAGLEATQREVNDFIDLTINRDNAAAQEIIKAKKDFYKEYDYLKPDSEKSDWEKFCDKLKDVGEWCKEHWKELLITVAIVIGAIIAIAAVIASGGLALVPLLTSLGLSASLAAGISTTVATIAVISTVGSGVMNIIDTWNNVDNPLFNKIQAAFNWTCLFSNSIYSIGSIYNGIKGISNASIIEQNGNRLVSVTRWGRPGLQSGDWVMRGKNTWFNYIRSCKWDFISPTNKFAPKSIGETFLVPLKTLHPPKGFGIDGCWKVLFGQWRYWP